MKIMHGAVTVEETTTTVITDIGNKVQETEQEIPPQDQIRAKEMMITEGKITMTNVDYVGKRAIGEELP